MTNIRLKLPIILPFILGGTVLFAMFLYGAYREQNNHIDRQLSDNLRVIEQLYRELLQEQTKQLESALELIASDGQIMRALRRRDRRALLKYTAPLFERLQSRSQITHLAFHDARRRNLLRMHEPGRFGDEVTTLNVLDAMESGDVASGVELDDAGQMVLRVVLPVRAKRKLRGYIEIGKSIEVLLRQIAPVAQVELYLGISKQKLSRERWVKRVGQRSGQSEWGRFPALVIPFQTRFVLPEEQLGGAVRQLQHDPRRIVAATVGETHFRIGQIPLRDKRGHVVGYALVVKDVTARFDDAIGTIEVMSVVTLLVALGLVGLFYVVLGRAESQMARWREKVAEEGQARAAIQERHIKELEHLANHDRLTGLPNRKRLDNRINQAIVQASREKEPFVIMLLDLDRLGEINDTLGHEVGDAVLREVADRLSAIQEENWFISHPGGGEFVVLLLSAGPNQAMAAVRKVQRIFKDPVEISKVKIDIGVSIGVVSFPNHGRDTSLLMRRADVAMRQAKQRKSGFAVYKSERDPYSVKRLKLVGDLRRAISAGELILHYQPQIDISKRDVVGVEALVRWQHPQQGLLPPMEFIPLAEQTGLIRPLTVWAIDQALQQASIWGLQGHNITVSVNLSVHNLLDKDLTGQVRRLLKKWKVPPQRLVLEITESNLMLEPEVALATLEKLQEMDVALSVDDFGTGYSSLAYLKTLPVSELKIDRSFVREMMQGESDAKIVHLIANLSHNLGLTVVAEGVEDEATWDKIAELGCDVVQGYYICKPLSAKEFSAWMLTTSWKRREEPDAVQMVH
ncbi:MAG TPA: EAL domain-containing protein [Gammaproteobacteria bacterium]|nr:EAL domain-containing protein [Gammaproteobacteria bacterium]